MNSFLGKCTTILIGFGLSWATITNPDVERLFAAAQQEETEELSASLAPVSTVPPNSSASTATNTTARVDDVPNEDRLHSLSNMLRELGATYLRVEKIGRKDPSEPDWFRVRCDLDAGPNGLKCCLEATRTSPEEAMEEVLRAVHHGVGKS